MALCLHVSACRTPPPGTRMSAWRRMASAHMACSCAREGPRAPGCTEPYDTAVGSCRDKRVPDLYTWQGARTEGRARAKGELLGPWRRRLGMGGQVVGSEGLLSRLALVQEGVPAPSHVTRHRTM